MGLPVVESPEQGLSIWKATLFVIGDVAGTGVLALPAAVLNTGWIGFPMMLLFAIMAAYAGVRLADCWVIIEERYKQGTCQSPYQSIAFQAYGTTMKRVVSVTSFITLFGMCIVLMLLTAEMLHGLLNSTWSASSICNWSAIVAIVLIPLSWFGTPKDFWAIAIVATGSVTVASVFLFVQCLLDSGMYTNVHHLHPDVKGFSLAFGTILFAFGGGSAFPSIQMDMRRKEDFCKSVIFGFIGVCLIYSPITMSSYFVYGSYLTTNVVSAMGDGFLKMAAQFLVLVHLMCAFIILINPVYQEIEGYLKIPQVFNWKKCLLRTTGILLALFIGETMPHFGKILNLIGGSTSTLLVFVLPCVFYMKLVQMKNPSWKERHIPLFERIFLWEVILIGCCGGIASTVSSLWDIADPDTFTVPCYLGG